MEPIIQAQGIAKQYIRNRGGSNVFYPVGKTDFTLQQGEIAVISGASGSGKTTLLNLLSGILAPTEGTVILAGQNLYRGTDSALSLFRNANIGAIPQGQTALHSLTVLENILLPFILYNKDKSLYQEKLTLAKALAERLQITDLAQVMPLELSGGELRRMAVARALMMEPTVIFADEPTADLDDCNTQIVLSAFKEMAQGGKGVVIATHDKEVIQLADTAYEMKMGVLTPYGG